jgi:hypothetical protein
MQAVAAAWFARRELHTQAKYPYILADRTDWPQNLVLPAVTEYIQAKQAANKGKDWFPLHKYLHHGLSSQALLFNLVGPLLVRGDLAPLQAAFAAACVPWPAGTPRLALEVSDAAVFHETKGQPTSLDFAVFGDGGAPLFVEAKLTEAAFGGCSVLAAGNCAGHNPLGDLPSCYLHRIGRTYWTQALAQGFAQSPLAAGPICPFALYYQFFRESLFALAKGGHFVLLYDERSPVFVRPAAAGASTPPGLWTFLAEQAPPSMAGRLHAATIQQVVTAIEQSGKHDDWVGVFKEKYGLE